MDLRKQKFWTTAIAVAVGGLILGSLWWITSYPPDPSKPVTASQGSAAAPQNPEHEKASLKELLQPNPGHTPILMRLAELEREAGRPAGAVPHLRMILEKEPANEEARLELGRALYESGDVEGATSETRRLVTDHPGNVDGLYNLGAIYANENHLDLAKQYWAKAVVASPASDSGRRAQDALLKLGL